MRFEPGTDFLESFLFSKIYFGKFQRIGFPQIKNFDFDFLNICINCLFLIIFRAIILCKKSIKKMTIQNNILPLFPRLEMA